MKPIEVSIIIPVLNEAHTIVPRLQALHAIIAGQATEIIIVDGGSRDATVELASAYADQVITSAKGRACQMNAGAQQAQGELLLFLHIDTQLPEQPFSVLQHTQADWGFYKVKLSGAHYGFRVIEAMMNIRSRLSFVATGDQCMWVRKSHFHKLNGFADIPLMEDVELSKRLRHYSAPSINPAVVITSSRRWEQYGITKTVLLMWYLRTLYFFGVAPSALVKKYYA